MGQSHAKTKKDMTPEEFDQMIRSSSFNSEELHAIHEQFKKDYPKGFIDKKSFKQSYATMFPQGSGADKFVDHIFRLYDADGNGQISFQEFISTLQVSTQGSPEDKLRASFRMYDVDRNGSITQKELTEILAVSIIPHNYTFTIIRRIACVLPFKRVWHHKHD
jgi:Ca2+-binding EF-hand superfamily protein